MNKTAVVPTLTPLSTTTPTWTTPSGSRGSSRSPCPRPRPGPPFPQPEVTPASPSPRTRTATAPWSASTGPSWWWTTRPGPGLLYRASPPSSRRRRSLELWYVIHRLLGWTPVKVLWTRRLCLSLLLFQFSIIIVYQSVHTYWPM